MSHNTDLAPIFVPKFLSKGVGVPPCGQGGLNKSLNVDPVAVFLGKVNGTDLLHVAQDVLTAVEDALAFLRIQVENEVSGVVGVGAFVPVSRPKGLIKCVSKMASDGQNPPEDQTPLHCRLHLLNQMLHISLQNTTATVTTQHREVGAQISNLTSRSLMPNFSSKM